MGGSPFIMERGPECCNCGSCAGHCVRGNFVREGDLVVLKQDYLCSGCGECVKWCPVHAITVRPVKPITVYRKVR